MNLYSLFSQKDVLILIQLVEKRYHTECCVRMYTIHDVKRPPLLAAQ
jgi:hypothetical protein